MIGVYLKNKTVYSNSVMGLIDLFGRNFEYRVVEKNFQGNHWIFLVTIMALLVFASGKRPATEGVG